MATTAPRPKSTYTPAPQGTHLARIWQYIHIGTVDEEVDGKPKRMNKIRLSFELPNETKEFKEGEGQKPISVHKEFTLSMHEKANLRKLIEGILGVSLTDDEAYSFDTESLVGMACLIQIKHKTSKNGNIRDEIASASPLMKGQSCPPQFNASKILSYSNWSESLFESLPQFMKEKIQSSDEWRENFLTQTSTLTPSEVATIEKARANETAALEKGDISVDDIKFD